LFPFNFAKTPLIPSTNSKLMSSEEDSCTSPIEKFECKGFFLSLLEEDDHFKDLDFPLQRTTHWGSWIPLRP
jgi:hypothetical protein